MTSERPGVGIVGAGAVAAALARALADGADVVVWARRAEAAEGLARGLPESVVAAADLTALADCEVVLVAVSDPAIGEVGAALAAAGLEPDAVVLHTSGLWTGAAALTALEGRAILGSLHPLVAVARDAAPAPFAGMPFAVEASHPRGEAVAAELVERLGGDRITLPRGDIERTKARYHALATLVATGVVTLVDRAADALASGAEPDAQGNDIDRDALRRAYARLAESAARNVLRGAGPEVLTGALARGDERTVAAHHAALAGDPIDGLYRAVEEAARRMLGDGS